MVVLSIDSLFDAAIRIQLLEQSITITFTDTSVRIRFPTTRKLAEFLQIPHYYVLPYFAMMEQEDLVTRAERVGILTTYKGSVKMLGMMETLYLQDVEAIIGRTVLEELIKKSQTGCTNQQTGQ
jgi:DNA-binding transcriptional regulator YhcF (GntR family)